MIEKELAKARDEDSNRRSFLRRALGFGAAAGAATLLLNRDKTLIPFAQAGSGAGDNVQIDVANYGATNTILESTATSGAAFAAFAVASSGVGQLDPPPVGVLGRSDHIGGIGVLGVASSGCDGCGVRGESSGGVGRGIEGVGGCIGVDGRGSLFGVCGQGNDVGLSGQALGLEWGVGVYGEGKEGVMGRSYSYDKGIGVLGYTDSYEGRGVIGHALGIGVLALALNESSIPIVSAGTSEGQTANLQEWAILDEFTDYFVSRKTLSVVDKDGNFGAGTVSPAAKVHGVADAGAAVRGDAVSSDGKAVVGFATAVTGHTRAIYGESASCNGFGVEGYASSTTGLAVGVSGRADSPDGAGIDGYASSTTGYTIGVYGRSDSASGVGVFGRAGSPQTKPMIAVGASGQTASLQEWMAHDFTPLSLVDRDGKLGVGVTPSYGVHIKTGTIGPFCGSSSPPGSAPNSMIFENLRGPSNVKNQLTFKGSGANRYSFGNDISGNGSQNFFIWDEVASQAVMYVDSNRRVGLGTLWPEQKLHIAGRVKAAGYDTGDITFANGYMLTEDKESGMLLLNQKGERIAKFDEQGNLHIKGDVIKDL